MGPVGTQVLDDYAGSIIRDILLSSDGSRALIVLQPNDRPAYKQIVTYDASSGKLTKERQREFGEGKDGVRLSGDGRHLAIVDGMFSSPMSRPDNLCGS